MIGIGAMAFKAFVGEDRPDVEIIADFSRARVVIFGMEAGGKDENASCDQGQYGSNAVDGDRVYSKDRSITAKS